MRSRAKILEVYLNIIIYFSYQTVRNYPLKKKEKKNGEKKKKKKKKKKGWGTPIRSTDTV